MKNYEDINRDTWNDRTVTHFNSDFYDVKGFIEGNNSLKPTEMDLLGDVKGKSVLHLQCHFGQDTLSIARMGALVTGVDLSDQAIAKADYLAKKIGVDANFVCCNVLDTDKYINEKFDIVFTSYGTIGWLPELGRWGENIKNLLKPGGKFVFVEFHPVVWMFDDDFKHIQYSYFNRETIITEGDPTYTDGDHKTLEEHSWNHSLSDVFAAMESNDLQVTHFNEFDYSMVDCFANCIKAETGFHIKGLEGKIPMVYCLVAEHK